METKETFDVSVILPISSAIHPFFDDLLERCIKSLQMQLTGVNELVIVHTDATPSPPIHLLGFTLMSFYTVV